MVLHQLKIRFPSALRNEQLLYSHKAQTRSDWQHHEHCCKCRPPHLITIATPNVITARADCHATAHFPVVSIHMLCRPTCVSHKHVDCRCNIGTEECVCGFVQPQQTPDLGAPSATPPQLYLHQEHCHSEFPVQVVTCVL